MPQPRHSGDSVHLASDRPSRHHSLNFLLEVPEWMADAMCAQTDPEAFFPEKGGSTREAKSICARCTVQAECLDAALDNDERFGIWGGLSERERRKLKPPTCKRCGIPLSHRGSYCDEHHPEPPTSAGLQARVRAWARANNLPGNARGTLHSSLVHQYLAANPDDPASSTAIHATQESA